MTLLVAAPEVAAAQSRDSAGVSIVSVSRSEVLHTVPFALSATPSLVIGVDPAATDY